MATIIDAFAARAVPAFVLDGPAACSGMPTKVFFPEPESPAALRKARRVCLRCPLYAPCGRWAVETGQQFGVWGGMSRGERERVRGEMGARKR
ncbi:MAG TPA: WhiB family transcriptional regulator [Micromonospora sp.]|nr:WhiB family transcriptional regulator [Micromonospora sp.]